MTIAVDLDVKNQNKQIQNNKDTPHARMRYHVKTGKHIHRTGCAYLLAYQGLYLPANTLYLYKELIIQSKEEGKDQESIQTSTTPDPGHHMTKQLKHKKTPPNRRPSHPSRRPQGRATTKVARNRQDGSNKY